MEIKALIHLILMMNALGVKIGALEAASFWRKISGEELPDGELLESLVLFWNEAVKRGQAESLHERAATPPYKSPPFAGQPAVAETSAVVEKTESAGQLLPGPAMDDEVQSNRRPESGVSAAPPPAGKTGRYIYGIGWGSAAGFQTAGIEGEKVYTIPFREITAIVHACEPKPYQSTDRERVTAWFGRHQDVLEEAGSKYRSVAPMGFDVIVDGSSAADPDEPVRKWLEERYEPLLALLKSLAGKAEYGVRIYYPKNRLSALARERNPKIDELSRRMGTMGEGASYLFRSELNNMLRKASEEICNELAGQIVEQLKRIADGVKEEQLVGGTITDQGQLVLNAAVLTEPSRTNAIGELLEECQKTYGVSVQFTGPWPPYSFVGDLD